MPGGVGFHLFPKLLLGELNLFTQISFHLFRGIISKIGHSSSHTLKPTNPSGFPSQLPCLFRASSTLPRRQTFITMATPSSLAAQTQGPSWLTVSCVHSSVSLLSLMQTIWCLSPAILALASLPPGFPYLHQHVCL